MSGRVLVAGLLCAASLGALAPFAPAQRSVESNRVQSARSLSPTGAAHAPRVGLRAGPVRVFSVAGDDAGREWDLAERSASRGVILFLRDLGLDTVPLLRAFDDLLGRAAMLGGTGGVVYLKSEQGASDSRLLTLQRTLALEHPILLGVDGGEGPGWLALDRAATVSVVSLQSGMVVDSFALARGGESDVPRLRDAFRAASLLVPDSEDELLTAAAKVMPGDPAELRAYTEARLRDLHRLYSRSDLREAEFAKVRAREAAEQVARAGSGPAANPGRGKTGAPEVALRNPTAASGTPKGNTAKGNPAKGAGAKTGSGANPGGNGSGKPSTQNKPTTQNKPSTQKPNPGRNVTAQDAGKPAAGEKPAAGKPAGAATAAADPNAAVDAPKPEKSASEVLDTKVLELFQSFADKANSKEASDQAFEAIRKRSEESKELASQVKGLFRRLLSDETFGSDYARGLARDFLGEKGSSKTKTPSSSS